LAWSPLNIIAWCPTIENSSDISSQELPIIGIFNPARVSSPNSNNNGSDNEPAWLFIHQNNFYPLTNSEKNHRCGEFITDIVWNKTGSALASIDQRGKIFIWIMDNYINRWTCFRDFDLGENLIEFSWLDHLRSVSLFQKTFKYHKD
jgi:hypothetical protein